MFGRDADEQQARFAQRAAEQSETDLPDEPPTPPRQLRSKGKGRASAAKPTFVLDEAPCSDADDDDDEDGSGSYEPESGGSNNEESSSEADRPRAFIHLSVLINISTCLLYFPSFSNR